MRRSAASQHGASQARQFRLFSRGESGRQFRQQNDSQGHSILNTVREADQERIEAGGWACNKCHSQHRWGWGANKGPFSKISHSAYQSVAWRSGWSATSEVGNFMQRPGRFTTGRSWFLPIHEGNCTTLGPTTSFRMISHLCCSSRAILDCLELPLMGLCK